MELQSMVGNASQSGPFSRVNTQCNIYKDRNVTKMDKILPLHFGLNQLRK